jgi:hypothetical protein
VAGELAEDLRHDDFSSFGAAHTCGYGYMSGTCPTSVCGAAPAAPAA